MQLLNRSECFVASLCYGIVNRIVNDLVEYGTIYGKIIYNTPRIMNFRRVRLCKINLKERLCEWREVMNYISTNQDNGSNFIAICIDVVLYY